MSFRKLFIVLVLVITSTAFAEWISLDNQSADHISFTVTQSNNERIVIEIVISGFGYHDVASESQNCIKLSMHNASKLMLRGRPLIPKLTKLIQIPNAATGASLQLIDKQEHNLALPNRVIPSKGHFSRNISPDSIPYEFGNVYHEDAFWPPEDELLQIGQPFRLRDVKGVRLQILPIRVNHVSMQMKVLQKLTIAVTFTGNETNSNFTEKIPARLFQRFYQNLFLNYRPPQILLNTIPDVSANNLLVICPQQFLDCIPNWVTWKRKCGYVVTEIVPENLQLDSASAIKDHISFLYDNATTQPAYIVLIGDSEYNQNYELAQPMPTFKGDYEGAASDRVYVRLNGADYYPDAFISRISGSSTQIQTQLEKIIAYEQYSAADGSWLGQGICVASNEGNPTDYERAEYLQEGGGSGLIPVQVGGLLGYGYSMFDDIYAPNASDILVADSINAGRSILCYIGHGTTTSWVTSGFNKSDINNLLTNGHQLPVIWSVACVNSAFITTEECFAEAWLRKANGGAVGFEGASTNESWVPPCDKQAATINAIIDQTCFTFGALEAVGCVAALEYWEDVPHSEGHRLSDQCLLMGDCSMLVRTLPPQNIQLESLAGNIFEVTTEDAAPVNFATVTIYNQNWSYAISGKTNEQGKVTLVPDANVGNLYVTVVAPNAIPIIDRALD